MAVCLITGCSSGFGLATALHFARAGETVVAGVRHVARAAELERRCAREGLAVDVVTLDVDDEASVVKAVAGVVDAHGRLDVLVNNAGVGLSGAIEESTDADVRQLFETNVFGPLRLLRAVLAVMRHQGGGVVVNISSLSGVVSAPFSGVYSATKFAVEALSEALHYEVKPFGIRVAIIEPGRFATTAFNDNRLVAGPDASPYSERRHRWDAAMERLPGRDQPAEADAVALAVYEAATRDDHPLRRLVGADAELVAGLRRDLDDASFEHTVRTALDFWD
ncbi:MAG: SDR family oxidoreductase [Acidimicrobiia bacterium]|nr:SDR family oxidoreductase [Acidimicrobiia bacterium]